VIKKLHLVIYVLIINNINVFDTRVRIPLDTTLCDKACQ